MRLDTISQYSSDQIGIAIVEINTPTDADGDVVTATITRQIDNVEVVTAALATHDDLGFYSYTLELGSVTAQKGVYTVVWDWEISGSARTFSYSFRVVDPQRYFDSLSAAEKELVDCVYAKVSDGFDSTREGGPYLWEMPQATFGFETIARLMVVDAATLINFSGPKAFVPPYTVGAVSQKPFPEGWYGLLERATCYELFKHLSTSYLEIPDPVGLGDIATLDRRRYSEMWMNRADHEMTELSHMIKMFKRAFQFGVKARSMIVAGGIFPISYLNPARPRWPYVLSRFY